MNFKPFVLMFSCASALTWIVAKADGPGIHLVRQSSTDRIDEINGHWVYRWRCGAYLLIDGMGGMPPVFYTLNREGRWTDTAQFRNPESTNFYTFDYDREADGTIVFSGQTETEPRVVAPFLAWTSADGKIQHLVRTGHYFPYKLAVAPDGTIWTLGYEMVNLDHEDPAVNKEAHVVRHFDRAGNLIGSAFPQSQFTRDDYFRIGHSLLVATQNRLGWYGPRSWNPPMYTEILLDTMTMKTYPGAPTNSRSDLAEELAMTSSGAAAVSVDHPPGDRTTYILDRSSSRWMPVSVPPMGGYKFTPMLIGSDGDNLVFMYASESGFFSVAQ